MKKIFYFIVTFIFIQIFISIPALGVESEEIKELENTNLETLAIEDVYLYPPFSNEITEYNTEISNDINNLNILAIPENENATVKIEKEDTLKVGDNIITIYVTAQDGKNTKQFNINVHKRTNEEETKYEEEQSQMDIKLNEAYKIEKLKTNGESTYESERLINYNAKDKIGKNINIFVLILVIIIIISILLYTKYKRKNKNK